MMYLNVARVKSKEVLQRLASVTESDNVKVSVKASSRDVSVVRFVTYWEITDDEIRAAIEKVQLVIKEFDAKF